ncbi:MAG: VCBS repeat-containing protein [Candidatus Hydrogenedentota bacterium]
MLKKSFIYLLFIFFISVPLFAESTQEIGKVVFVKGDEFYFDIGETTGLRPGMNVEVYKIGSEIKDPNTDAILGYEEEKIASGEVIFVREQISCAKAKDLSASIQINVGDKVVAYLFSPAKDEIEGYAGPLLYKTAPTSPDVIAEFLIDKFEAKDFTLGDFNGDGRKEIAVTNGEDILFYTYYGAKFMHYYTFKGPWNAKFIDVSAGDFNANQKDELFVTNKPGNFTQLLVYEFDTNKNELIELFKTKNRYANVVTLNREKILLGQEYGYTSPFIGPVLRLIWKGTNLTGRKMNLPHVDSLYGFLPLDFTGDGFDEYAALDRDDFLRLYNSNNKEIYKSPMKYGGSNIKIIARDRKTQGYKIDLIRKDDLDGDLIQEIIAVKNIRLMDSALFALKGGLNPFRDSQIFGLKYKMGMLEVIWETQKLGGYICNLEITDINEDNKKDLLICIITDFDKKGKSVLRAFDLKTLQLKKTSETTK